MKILIVDNDDMQRKTLDSHIQKLGHDILEASDGRQALAVTNKQSINVIVIDWILPDMEGIKLCRNIREKVTDRYVYIVMLTLKNEKNDQLKGYAAGADAVATKPCDLEAFEALIKVGDRITGFGQMTAEKKDPALDNRIKGKDSTGKELDTENRDRKKVGDISGRDMTIGRLALENKLVTKKQLARAFSIQQKARLAGREISLDKIFREKDMISPDMMNNLMVATKRKLGKKFGEIALEKGFASQEQVDRALKEQAEEFKKDHSCRRTGDIMVDQGALTPEQCESVRRELEDIKKRSLAPKTIGEKQKIAIEEKEKDITESKGPTKHENDTEDKTSEDSKPELIISEDKMTAHIRLTEDLYESIGLDKINTLLEEAEIKFGIMDDATINDFLKSNDAAQTPFVIAEGKPPVFGKDAQIRFHFDTDYLKAGTIMEDGVIDFMKRGDVPHVKKGDLFAEKIAMETGKDGVDVYGKTVPVGEPEDIQFKCDAGVEVSEDGMKAFAKIEGQPNVTVGGKLSVFSEFDVKGDVDYGTGNIEFDGNINVRGTVKDGFSVKGGNLNAKEILGAKIHVKGDVVVSGGIIGADIQAEGIVKAKYIKDANIKAYGDVIVQKEIRESKIRTSGACKAERGEIISSLVATKQGIAVKNMGTDISEPCTIKVGVDEHIRKIVQGYDQASVEAKESLEDTQENYDKLLKKLNSNHKIMAETAQEQDGATVEQRDLKTKIEELKNSDKKDELSAAQVQLKIVNEKVKTCGEKIDRQFNEQDQLGEKIADGQKRIEKIIEGIETLNNEKRAVMEWSNKDKCIPIVKITGSIVSGTMVSGKHSKMILKEDIRNASIKEVKVSDAEWNMEIIK